MATPYFVADSASVTIMRSLASSSYGSYSLNLPDGIELEDVHDFDAPDNTLGYVAHVGHGRRVGGLARRFVRADVNVTAADPSDPDRFPDSDVDRVLRDVAERVSGDFFLESDVSKAGLGPWVPHVDFKVGDLARVEIWGQVVVLPVTRIEEVVSDHDIVDWRVHVGGQLVSDEEARKAENLALHRAFLQDRRELAGVEGQVKAVDKKAEDAKSTADAAKGTAEDAKSTADDALAAVGDADGVFQSRLEESRRLIEEGRGHAQQVAGHVAEAGRLAGDADRYAREAVSAADQADQILATIEGNEQEVAAALSQVSALHEQVTANVALAQQAVADGQAHVEEAGRQVTLAQGHAGSALDYAREAGILVDEAEQLAQQMQAMQSQMTQMILAGRQYVAAASGQAALAVERAGESQRLVDEARVILGETAAHQAAGEQAVEDARAEVVKAEQAVADAGAVLEDVEAARTGAESALGESRAALAGLRDLIGGEIPADQGTIMSLYADILAQHQDIFTMHGETLAAHDDVLVKHQAAITAATNAAGSAADAAGEALVVTGLHGEVLAKHGEAIDLAAQAAADAGIAADEAGSAAGAALDAQEIQTQINATQDRINALYARAIRAAAASGAQAGVAAMQAAMAADNANRSAQSALDAAALNADSITVLEESQGLLQVAVESNADAIGKLRDAQVLMDEAIRSAAAAAESAGAAADQSGKAAEESGKAAGSALEATAALDDAVVAAEEAQQARNDAVDAALTRHGNQSLLHDNALKWQKWRTPIFDFTPPGDPDNLTTGLVDIEFNVFQGKGVRLIRRPGWSGRFQLTMRYTDDSLDTVNGRAVSATASRDESLSLDRTVRWATIQVWPDHGVEPREWAIPVDEQGRWSVTDWAQAITKDDVTGWIKFPVSVIPSRDIQAREQGLPAETFSSDRPIPATHWVVPDGEEDVVIFTEEQGNMVWEIGAPSSGIQRLNVASRTPSPSTWATVASWRGLDWSSPVDAQLQFFIRWDKKNPIASTSYSARILVDGENIGQLRRGGFGSINLDFNLVRQHTLQPGSQIQFQVHSTAGFYSERRVSSGYAQITWG